MRKILLATATLLAISAPAHAVEDLICDAPHVYFGDNPKTFVTDSDVWHNVEQHKWMVRHYVADGPTVNREEQYNMIDFSDERRSVWTGELKTNSNMFMAGEIKRNPAGKLVYVEKLFDMSYQRRPKLEMKMEAICEHRIGGGDIQPEDLVEAPKLDIKPYIPPPEKPWWRR
jgi:hypothetical protein